MGLTRISGDVIQTPLNVGVVTATRIDSNVNSTGVSTFSTIKVGTGVTIHHTNGIQVGENTLHSSGLTLNTFNQTTSVVLPKGTTQQRPSSPSVGSIRFNTTLDLCEQYLSTGWTAIDIPPVISSVSPSSFTGVAGTTFTLTGDRFRSTDTVKFVTVSGTEYTAGTVTFVGVTTLTATTPQNFTVNDEPLSVKVVRQSGLSVTLNGAIDCGGTPVWSTASGSVGVISDRYGSYSPITTLSATDPDGQTITYSVTSGSLPAGTSLNSSTGVISGDPTDLNASTATSNFTVSASDGVNSTSRSFSMVVNAAKDGTASYRGALTGRDILTLTPSATNGSYYIDPYTNATYSNSNSYTVDMSGGGWITVDIENIPSSNYYAIMTGQASYLTNINWNSGIANHLFVGGTSGSNNGENWSAYFFDRKLMGRVEEYNGWRDWDVTWRASYSWGWGQFTLMTVSTPTGTLVGDRSTVSGSYGFSGSGDAGISIRNNNSNNLNQVDYAWWNGSSDTSSTIYSVTGVSDSTIHRMTLIQGVLTYYKGGSQVGSWNLTNSGSYSGTQVTANTKWIWYAAHQNPSWIAISSMKVR